MIGVIKEAKMKTKLTLLAFLALTFLLLSGCDLDLMNRPTETPEPSLTPSPIETPTNTPTLRETPTPEVKVNIFDSSTFPAEMQKYLADLPARTTAESGSSLEATYISEDKAFHDNYMNYMKSYLKSIGVDTSSIEAFSGADWENYDNAIKAYEILWKQLAKTPENYNTSWQLTPWLLRGDGKTNSSITFTPSACAFSYFDPGALPSTR